LNNKYDIIIAGGGHAGCEAAAAAANLGSKVLLITMNMGTIASMSCNPAMGGIAKGQILREVDALGGYSGIVSDESMIQFRMLNRSKGPAMWSPRTQNDRVLFAIKWREKLESIPNLDMWQDMVTGIYVSRGTNGENQVTGVKTQLGIDFHAKSVILTSGTFLNGKIHIGSKNFGGGRMGEKGATGITEQLEGLGFESDRLKTGTPPRVDGRSLDYSKFEIQEGDEEIVGFSYLDSYKPKAEEQIPCHIAYTNPEVHEILRVGFEDSPMFSGRIQGTGPRYCPSIEDKIDRFAERERHQLFIEPEGWKTIEIYLNGFSTSLAEDIQYNAMTKIPGFEQVKMFRPGYAIEYDYFPPTQLQYNLETKLVKNLFFAGQINGTTGYEEAACQGLMAGINAHNNVEGKESFILARDEAYIGVLIDDLINKGTDEPYRMFTSRAEFRTILRQDNADLRLTEISNKLGLASNERMHMVESKLKEIDSTKSLFEKTRLKPNEINPYLESIESSPLREHFTIKKILCRPEIELDNLLEGSEVVREIAKDVSRETLEQVSIQLKYETYINKEKDLATKAKQLEDLIIPDNFDYDKLPSMRIESRQKFNKIRPRTIGQASRISGVNPTDIQILMVYMGR
jgi:tRNA uridine 5-carboxymethylaminomethyl modification enzyme